MNGIAKDLALVGITAAFVSFCWRYYYFKESDNEEVKKNQIKNESNLLPVEFNHGEDPNWDNQKEKQKLTIQ
eukprot:Awhi_evm1s11776